MYSFRSEGGEAGDVLLQSIHTIFENVRMRAELETGGGSNMGRAVPPAKRGRSARGEGGEAGRGVGVEVRNE